MTQTETLKETRLLDYKHAEILAYLRKQKLIGTPGVSTSVLTGTVAAACLDYVVESYIEQLHNKFNGDCGGYYTVLHDLVRLLEIRTQNVFEYMHVSKNEYDS